MGKNFELCVQRAYEAILRPGDVAIDVGAHLGDHTIPMARAVAPGGRVHAFEPLDACRARLEERIKTEFGDLAGVITVRGEALSDYEGDASYVVAVDALAYSGLRKRMYDIPTKTESVQVSVRTLDSLFADLQALRYVKIDAEGGEYHILRGALGTLSRLRPVVGFEFGAASIGEYNITTADMGQLWFDADYKIYDVNGELLPTVEAFAESGIRQHVWDYVAIPPEKSAEEAAIVQALRAM